MIAVVLILVLLAAAVAGFFIFKAINGHNSGNSDTTSENANNADNSDTSENSDNTSEDTAKDGPEAAATSDQTPTQYEGENPNSLEQLTGIVSFAGVANNSFLVNVTIDQYIAGTCSFVLEGPSGARITSSADIEFDPATTYCSYSGPVPTSGDWKIIVTVTESTGEHRTGTITGEATI